MRTDICKRILALTIISASLFVVLLSMASEPSAARDPLLLDFDLSLTPDALVAHITDTQNAPVTFSGNATV